MPDSECDVCMILISHGSRRSELIVKRLNQILQLRLLFLEMLICLETDQSVLQLFADVTGVDLQEVVHDPFQVRVLISSGLQRRVLCGELPRSIISKKFPHFRFSHYLFLPVPSGALLRAPSGAPRYAARP